MGGRGLYIYPTHWFVRLSGSCRHEDISISCLSGAKLAALVGTTNARLCRLTEAESSEQIDISNAHAIQVQTGRDFQI